MLRQLIATGALAVNSQAFNTLQLTDGSRAVLKGERDPARWPTQVIRPENGEVLWLVDRAAASGLEKRSGS